MNKADKVLAAATEQELIRILRHEKEELQEQLKKLMSLNIALDNRVRRYEEAATG